MGFDVTSFSPGTIYPFSTVMTVGTVLRTGHRNNIIPISVFQDFLDFNSRNIQQSFHRDLEAFFFCKHKCTLYICYLIEFIIFNCHQKCHRAVSEHGGLFRHDRQGLPTGIRGLLPGDGQGQGAPERGGRGTAATGPCTLEHRPTGRSHPGGILVQRQWLLRLAWDAPAPRRGMGADRPPRSECHLPLGEREYVHRRECRLSAICGSAGYPVDTPNPRHVERWSRVDLSTKGWAKGEPRSESRILKGLSSPRNPEIIDYTITAAQPTPPEIRPEFAGFRCVLKPSPMLSERLFGSELSHRLRARRLVWPPTD